MGLKARQLSRKPRIEMIPLIDAMFLILVYFIYAFLSMSVHHGIPLRLPAAQAGQKSPKKIHAVSVDKEGVVYFDKREVSLPELEMQLKMLRQQEPLLKISLYADKDTRYADFIRVLDILKRQKIQKIFIETKPQKHSR